MEKPTALACFARCAPQVVAADLNTSGTKDYVEFKIRVADDSGEWTVSRRYRQFESLHRQLRCYPCYRLKLPPKRIFVHSNRCGAGRGAGSARVLASCDAPRALARHSSRSEHCVHPLIFVPVLDEM